MKCLKLEHFVFWFFANPVCGGISNTSQRVWSGNESYLRGTKKSKCWYTQARIQGWLAGGQGPLAIPPPPPQKKREGNREGKEKEEKKGKKEEKGPCLPAVTYPPVKKYERRKERERKKEKRR